MSWSISKTINVVFGLFLIAGIGVASTGYVDLVKDREARDADIARWFNRTNDAAEYEDALAHLYAGRGPNRTFGAGTVKNPADNTIIAGKNNEITAANAALTAANAALTAAEAKMGRMIFAPPDFGKCGEGEKSVVARWTDTCGGIPVACEAAGDATVEASTEGYVSDDDNCYEGDEEPRAPDYTKCNNVAWVGYFVEIDSLTCGVALVSCEIPTPAVTTMASLTNLDDYVASPATAGYCHPTEENPKPTEPPPADATGGAKPAGK